MQIFKKIEAVFFDAGLVILHPNANKIRNLLKDKVDISSCSPKQLVDAYTYTIYKRDNSELIDLSAEWFWKNWCKEVGINCQNHDVVKDTLDNYDKFADEERLWDVLDKDIVKVLLYLKERNIKITIVSNSDGRLRDDIKLSGLDKFVDVAIDSHIEGVSKPNLKIFEIACDRSNISNKENVCFVGDEVRSDILPSKKFGFGKIFHYDRLDIYRDLEGVIRINNLSEMIGNI